MKQGNVRNMVFCALFAALIAVSAQIQFPVGPVPISLATFAVMMGGLLLGWKGGLLAVAVYLLLGAVGAPVFAGLKGGVAVLAGPTGGYLVGYLPYAALAGLGGAAWQEKFWGRCALLLCGTAVCYLLGTAWFMYQSGRGLADSLTLCVFPFLPGDAAKIALAAFLAPRLRQALRESITA